MTWVRAFLLLAAGALIGQAACRDDIATAREAVRQATADGDDPTIASRTVTTIVGSLSSLVRVPTGELNRVLKQIMTERAPSTPTGRRIKVFYVTQADVAPPTIVMFVNHPDDVTESYKRFMVNRFRELLPFSEVPIRLLVRGRAGAPSDAEAFEPAQSRSRPAKRAKTRPKTKGPTRRRR